MATFITVTQEGSELLRRNREQTQANRLGKLEGDEQARTEKEAKRQRQAELQRQGLDASGNALGDGRRRAVFRRDEPAAALLVQPALLVTWDGRLPVISDPQAENLYPGDDTGRGFGTTITAGSQVPALGLTGGDNNTGSIYNYWTFRTSRYRINARSDFTYEAWIQLTNASQSMVISRLDLGGDARIYMSNLYANGSFGIVPTVVGHSFTILDPVNGFSQMAAAPGQPFEPMHVCFMRRAGAFYWFISGIPVAANTSPEALAVTATGPTGFEFGLYSYYNPSTAKLGPLRLTPNRARYNIAGFTPDPLPFRP